MGGADDFNLNAGTAGAVSGGRGIDQLDYSGRTGPVSVNVNAAGGNGFGGSATGTASIAGIDDLVGSSATDTLTGSITLSNATFAVTSTNTGSLTDANSSAVLTFSA